MADAAPDADAGRLALQVAFEGPPDHESGRFIEVETPDGASVRAGRGEQRGGYWHLILTADDFSPSARIAELERDLVIAARRAPRRAAGRARGRHGGDGEGAAGRADRAGVAALEAFGPLRRALEVRAILWGDDDA